MNIGKCLTDLSDKEKIDLAARLTKAAMSALEYRVEQSALQTQQEITELAANRAYMVFGKLLNMIDAGQEPQKFPGRK